MDDLMCNDEIPKCLVCHMNPIMTEDTDEVGLVSDPGEEVAPACVCVSCAKTICEQAKCPDCDSHVVMHEHYIQRHHVMLLRPQIFHDATCPNYRRLIVAQQN